MKSHSKIQVQNYASSVMSLLRILPWRIFAIAFLTMPPMAHGLEPVQKVGRIKPYVQNPQYWLTDMFDDGYKPMSSSNIRLALDMPDTYSFIDISQVNSRTFNEDHWDALQWYMREIQGHPRPLNNTKIYGSGNLSFGTGTPADGIERFWRNIIAGCASARFHRSPAGNALNPNANASIQAARKIEKLVGWWNVQTRNDLLLNRESDEAYLACQPGKSYVLYFTEGGSVGLDLRGHDDRFALRWVDISTGKWGSQHGTNGDQVVRISAPSNSPWVAVLSRSE